MQLKRVVVLARLSGVELRIRSGVYAIRNLVNGRLYIGQALDLDARWRFHLVALRAGRHQNRPLQADWRAYGSKNFKFVMIFEVPSGEVEALRKAEIHYIRHHSAVCYNLTHRAHLYNIRADWQFRDEYQRPRVKQLNADRRAFEKAQQDARPKRKPRIKAISYYRRRRTTIGLSRPTS